MHDDELDTATERGQAAFAAMSGSLLLELERPLAFPRTYGPDVRVLRDFGQLADSSKTAERDGPYRASVPAFSRFATSRARSGEGEQLATHPLAAASLLAETACCEQWLVHRDQADVDTIGVSEIWASQKRCDAALAFSGLAENASA
jgi:hypothetical protein